MLSKESERMTSRKAFGWPWGDCCLWGAHGVTAPWCVKRCIWTVASLFLVLFGGSCWEQSCLWVAGPSRYHRQWDHDTWNRRRDTIQRHTRRNDKKAPVVCVFPPWFRYWSILIFLSTCWLWQELMPFSFLARSLCFSESIILSSIRTCCLGAKCV